MFRTPSWLRPRAGLFAIGSSLVKLSRKISGLEFGNAKLENQKCGVSGREMLIWL